MSAFCRRNLCCYALAWQQVLELRLLTAFPGGNFLNPACQIIATPSCSVSKDECMPRHDQKPAHYLVTFVCKDRLCLTCWTRCHCALGPTLKASLCLLVDPTVYTSMWSAAYLVCEMNPVAGGPPAGTSPFYQELCRYRPLY